MLETKGKFTKLEKEQLKKRFIANKYNLPDAETYYIKTGIRYYRRYIRDDNNKFYVCAKTNDKAKEEFRIVAMWQRLKDGRIFTYLDWERCK